MNIVQIKMKMVAITMACVGISSCNTSYHIQSQSDSLAILTNSKFKLPRKIDSFSRVYITKVDNYGFDIACGYNSISKPTAAALTVFVVSSRSDGNDDKNVLKNYFDLSSAQIRAMHGVRSYGDVCQISGHHGKGMLQQFVYVDNFAGREQQVCSLLAVFSDGNRQIKYRITGPENEKKSLFHALYVIVATLTEIN